MTDLPIDRRGALWRLALAGLAGGSMAGAPRLINARGASSSADLSVNVLLGETIDTIKPAIYGQFAEHIGGVIYDGIWVGPDSKIANTDGIRQTLIDHVKQVGPVVVRWPGGCFADKYHWRDGIGPPSALRGRAVFRGQRRHRLARGIPAVGGVLQRPGRVDDPRR
jgi:alpha-L-arabinofuranosidase